MEYKSFCWDSHNPVLTILLLSLKLPNLQKSNKSFMIIVYSKGINISALFIGITLTIVGLIIILKRKKHLVRAFK